MCGIFGIVNNEKKSAIGPVFKKLARLSTRRGSDSSGVILATNSSDSVGVYRSDENIHRLQKEIIFDNSSYAAGHSRLITNALNENQPVVRDNIIVLHNGIVVNEQEIWSDLNVEKRQQIDTEAIVGICLDGVQRNLPIEIIAEDLKQKIKGTMSCAIFFVALGKLLLISNNGSLFWADNKANILFASEKFFLKQVTTSNIEQIIDSYEIIDIQKNILVEEFNLNSRKRNLIPTLSKHSKLEKLLVFKEHNLRRCSKCILTETMPFITFDDDGVCNYCLHYRKRNEPKPLDELLSLLEPYRRSKGPECILPFSGGRDSCFAMHLVIKELKMKPIAYTYDWGMVTDLGRRNISRMCSSLNVENIIVAADITKKRSNIKKNLDAFLRSPHLGLISLLTAGDKHFFRYVQTIKQETGINLDIWGVNPLEVTHFKTGFLGIPPNFMEKKVYNNGILNQIRYHRKRFGAMSSNYKYFNSSLWDTLSGEYFRSILKKENYYHLFDYWRWDEGEIDSVLRTYDWELAPDTSTTWRIGDGTAAFYNYVYYTSAGFTEHDTFRSNQIREGQITRSAALELALDENRPRYANLQWYFDVLGVDFETAIMAVNKIPKLNHALYQ